MSHSLSYYGLGVVSTPGTIHHFKSHLINLITASTKSAPVLSPRESGNYLNSQYSAGSKANAPDQVRPSVPTT